MTHHDDTIRLRHMCDYAAEAIEMVRGRKRADLDTDRKLNLALVRLIKIVGEAAARVSAETRTQHPDVPWGDIVGMRNRIVHGYDQVDFDILWDVIELNLPSLVEYLRDVLGPQDK